jgi:arylsulfatase A-like enzyme
MGESNDVPASGGPVVDRRTFLAAGTAALATGLAAETRAEDVPPHVVYIVVDDLGWKDVGFHGSDILTPNLDALAAGGARLGQFYTQPLCTPTRAALLTGRYPLRYGLQTGVIPAAGTYGLATDEYLMPQTLKDIGYRTALVGKWHLGHADMAYWPRQRGFDSFYGALVGEIDHFEHTTHGVKDWYRDNEPLVETGFDNTLFGTEAAALIAGHDASQPLFLYLALTAPHTPYQAPPEAVARYAHISDEQRRLYAAMVSVMDDEIGRVVAALDAAGMRGNTLIVFHSDNGGVRSAMFAGDTPVTGELPADNGPFREGKGTLYEGGTRVVAIANWPGQVEPGEVSGMMHVVDMLPTIAAVTGASLAKSKPLDGMNVWETVSGGAPSPRTGMVYNVDPTGGAIRSGDMKLIWSATLPPRVELFDLADDPSETDNLAASDPALVADLQAGIEALAREMQPPLLIGEAIRLTYGAAPVQVDLSSAFSQSGG